MQTTISDILYQLVNERGLTADAIAKVIGVKPETVGQSGCRKRWLDWYQIVIVRDKRKIRLGTNALQTPGCKGCDLRQCLFTIQIYTSVSFK